MLIPVWNFPFSSVQMDGLNWRLLVFLFCPLSTDEYTCFQGFTSYQQCVWWDPFSNNDQDHQCNDAHYLVRPCQGTHDISCLVIFHTLIWLHNVQYPLQISEILMGPIWWFQHQIGLAHPIMSYQTRWVLPFIMYNAYDNLLL